ncbi:hypothetical protein LTR53_019121, partial [Teratosphaeriaceae sp. CCFEE 6253]
MQGAREQLQVDDSEEDDDDGSVYEDEEDDDGDAIPHMDERRLRHLTWAEHPAMRAHSALALHSRDASQATNTADGDLIDQYMGPSQQQQQQQQPQQHQRVRTNSSALTLDTNLHKNHVSDPAAFVEDAFTSRNSVPGGVAGARPR